MRASDSRLADRLMFVTWVTTNTSQRIGRLLVHLPVPVTFNLSQLALRFVLVLHCRNEIDCVIFLTCFCAGWQSFILFYEFIKTGMVGPVPKILYRLSRSRPCNRFEPDA